MRLKTIIATNYYSFKRQIGKIKSAVIINTPKISVVDPE